MGKESQLHLFAQIAFRNFIQIIEFRPQNSTTTKLLGPKLINRETRIVKILNFFFEF